MLVGRYYHALEQKGRLSIPQALRSELGNTAVLTPGLDGCLFLFADTQWEAVAKDAQRLAMTKKSARDWVRYLANGAANVAFDRVGRILVPEHLRTLANLEKACVVVGSLNRVEIWDQEAYHTYFDTLAEQAENLAESLEQHVDG